MDDVRTLDSFSVVAIRGKGIWVTGEVPDSDGSSEAPPPSEPREVPDSVGSESGPCGGPAKAGESPLATESSPCEGLAKDGGCWHVGGPDEDAPADDPLVAAYRDAFDGDGG